MSISNLKCKTKEFLNKNKEKIKTGAKCIMGCTVLLGTGALIIDNRNKRKIIDNMKEMIVAQSQQIENLKGLCCEKDNFFKRFISELFRQGNSEGARQMAYRKYWLEKQ